MCSLVGFRNPGVWIRFGDRQPPSTHCWGATILYLIYPRTVIRRASPVQTFKPDVVIVCQFLRVVMERVLSVPSVCAQWSDMLTRGFPAIQAFEPDLVIVSAGYDALEADELATASLQPEDFGRWERASNSFHYARLFRAMLCRYLELWWWSPALHFASEIITECLFVNTAKWESWTPRSGHLGKMRWPDQSYWSWWL